MNDLQVKMKMQEIARAVAAKVPDRAFFVLVWPSEPGQQAIYVGNASRDQAVEGMKDFITRNGGPNLPVGDRN